MSSYNIHLFIKSKDMNIKALRVPMTSIFKASLNVSKLKHAKIINWNAKSQMSWHFHFTD